jgi:hypothetical protein
MQNQVLNGLSRADAVRKFAREHPKGILSSRLLTP